MASVGGDQGSGMFNDSTSLFGPAGGDSSAAFQGEVNSIRESGNNGAFNTAVGESQKGWADFSCAIFDGNNPPEITDGPSGQNGPNNQNSENLSNRMEDADRNTALAVGLGSIKTGDKLSESVKDNLAIQMASTGTIDVKTLMGDIRKQQLQT